VFKRLLPFLLLMAPQAQAAISVVQCNSGHTAANNQSVTLNGVAAGNALWLAATCNAAGNSDFIFTGATFTRLVTQSQSNFQLQQWEALNQSSGNYTINGSLTGCSQFSMALCEVSGLSNSGQPDGTNNSGSVQTNPPINSGSLTNTAANVIFLTAVAAYVPAGSNNWTVPTGYTIPTNGNVVDGYLAVAYNIVSSTGAQNPQWTTGTGPQFLYADIVSLKAASGGTTKLCTIPLLATGPC